MARPIEATPVLRGKVALAFIREAQNPQPYTPPVIDMEKLDKHVTEALEKRAKK